MTASTDRVDLLTYPLRAEWNLTMRGMVTYVGRSSLNVDVDLTADPTTAGGRHLPVMSASLTFVARSASAHAVAVPRLQPETAAEVALYDEGARGQEMRKKARGESVYVKPPTPSELALVHELFTQLQECTVRPGGSAERIFTPAAAGSHMFMEDARLSSTFISQPEERNLHGKVFGGMLMRRAFEVAWACGWTYTGVLPKFLSLDDVTFLLPVDVGSLMRFDAQIDYATGPPAKTYHVSVHAYIRPTDAAGNLQAERLTNSFHFTFYCDDPARVPRVFPRTYEDAMRYVEAARRMKYGQALAEARKVTGTKLRFPAQPAARYS